MKKQFLYAYAYGLDDMLPLIYTIGQDTHLGLQLIGQILGNRAVLQALAARDICVDQATLDSLATIYTEVQSPRGQ